MDILQKGKSTEEMVDEWCKRGSGVSWDDVREGVDGHGNTALHWAAFKNLPVQTSLLLSLGCSPNSRAHPSGWTPLHDSAYSDASLSMSLLISAGASIDARASSGATPLCFSAQEDSPRTCEILIKAGADPGVRCEGGEGRFSGYTPLHYCAHYNAFNSCRVLIKYDAPLDCLDLAGRLPIHIAVARGSEMVLEEVRRGHKSKRRSDTHLCSCTVNSTYATHFVRREF